MATERWQSYKQTDNSLISIKQANKISVVGRQNKGREDVITRKRLKLNSLLEYDNASQKRSENEENEQVRKAIKCLKKGDKLKTLTDLHRLFSSHESNADQFIKHDGLQPLHSCFKSCNVDILHTSAWCVINLTAAASSSYSTALLGLAPTLMQFLKGSDVIMQELCAWGLANLAGDSPSNADILHKQGCADALMDLLETNYLHNEERTKSVLFALINLARSNKCCVKCMYDKDISGKLKALLKRISVDSILNFEVGWLLCSIHPWFDDTSLQQERLSMVTRLVSDRLNHVSVAQELTLRDKVCFPFVRCLCNTIGLDPLMARVVLDDVRTFKVINNLLTSGVDNVKLEILGLVNNCAVDVCSRVLLTLQPSVLLGVFSQCHNKRTDLATQALQIVQAMARTSAHVDSHLVQCGILSVLAHIIGSVTNQPCDRSHENVEEQLARGEAAPLKIAVGVLLDLAMSLPDVVRSKLNEENPQRKSTLQSSLTRLAHSDVQQVDTDLAHQATQLLHIFISG